jgi:hypothetical protein
MFFKTGWGYIISKIGIVEGRIQITEQIERKQNSAAGLFCHD